MDSMDENKQGFSLPWMFSDQTFSSVLNRPMQCPEFRCDPELHCIFCVLSAKARSFNLGVLCLRFRKRTNIRSPGQSKRKAQITHKHDFQCQGSGVTSTSANPASSLLSCLSALLRPRVTPECFIRSLGEHDA